MEPSFEIKISCEYLKALKEKYKDDHIVSGILIASVSQSVKDTVESALADNKTGLLTVYPDEEYLRRVL